MRDRLFFALAALLAALFVLVALNPFAERLPTGPVSAGGRDVMNVEVAGMELHRFDSGGASGLEFLAPDDDEPARVRITRKASEETQDPRLGAHLVLDADLEFAYQTRTIRIEIEARSAGDFPASQFEADYFAKAEGESGWQKFNLTPAFATYSFTFKIPSRGETMGYDYLGIRPVAPDKQRTMEVRAVRFIGQ